MNVQIPLDTAEGCAVPMRVNLSQPVTLSTAREVLTKEKQMQQQSGFVAVIGLSVAGASQKQAKIKSYTQPSIVRQNFFWL